MTALHPLHQHQVAALDGIRDAIRSGARRVVLQAPTGAGKTVIASHMVAGIKARAKRVAFCVPALSLVDQTFERFRENGIDPSDMGIVQADHPWRRPDAPIQICTAQTLSRRDLPGVNYVIPDEAHIRFAVYDRWMDGNPDVIFIGLSATPWAKGMGKRYQRLVRPTSLANLIDKGFLSRFRAYAPSKPDLDGLPTRQTQYGTDYAEDELAERANRPELVADIVDTWLRLGRGRPTLCFAVNRQHAKSIHDRFAGVGVRAGYVDANTPRDERDAMGKQLGRGELDVVVNIGCLTTGIDWDVRCLILARPTKSEMLFCLDKETEILTSHGWKGIGQIAEGECAAAYDPTTGTGCWSRVVATVERDMESSEAWIEYDAPRANFRVTDKHKMLFRSKCEVVYRLGEASSMLDVKGEAYMPTAVTINQPGVPLTDAELYFIGMMMTDGTWGRIAGSISQSERHPEVIDRIERCLRVCGIAYAKRRIASPASVGAAVVAERHPRWQFSISVGRPKPYAKLGTGFAGNYSKREWERFDGERGFGHLLPFMDKDLSPSLMALSKSQFIKLIEGIFDGDGFKMKSASVDWTPRSWTICSARKLVVDRLQALSAIHGMTANVRHEVAGRSNPIWVITITPKDWRSVGGYSSTGKSGGAPRGARPQIQMRQATSERVWCVQTEAGTIVTRRLGKVTVMGNCQIVGRGLRVVDGKPDCLILDHSDTHARLGFVTDVEAQHDALDDGSARKVKGASEREKKAPLPRTCPACTALLPIHSRVCAECGTELPTLTGVKHIDGELAEIGGHGTRRNGKVPSVTEALRCLGPEAVLSQLQWVAIDRNKKPGWVAHTYQEIFGDYPPRVVVPAHEPDPMLKSYIKHKQIKWARSHRNVRGAHHG